MVGMVPALFTDDEKEGIINEVRNNSINDGYGTAK